MRRIEIPDMAFVKGVVEILNLIQNISTHCNESHSGIQDVVENI